MKLFLSSSSSSFPKSLSASPSHLLSSSSSSSFSSSSFPTRKFLSPFVQYVEAGHYDPGPTHLIVHSYVKAGLYAHALDAALRRNFYFPSGFPAINTGNLLLTSLMERQHHSVAIALWEQWKLLGFIGNEVTFSMMIEAHCKIHDFSGAARVLFKDMVEAGLGDTVIFTHSVYYEGLCSNGCSYLAFKFLIAQQRIWQRVGMFPSHNDYATVLRGFCSEMKMEAAEKVMVAMKACGHLADLSCYTDLIHGYSRLGRMERAIELFEEARRKKLALNAFHYTMLMSGYRRKEDMENMLGVFYEMKKSGIKPDFVAYSIVIHGCCWAGMMSKVEELTREMVSSGAGTYNKIINRMIEGLYRCGKEEGAEMLVDQRKAQEIKMGLYTLTTGK